MRIKCEMDIINRLLPSMNVKKGGRSCHTQLSIGKKPQSDSKEGTLFLMVCTAQDKNGTKFQIKDNVEQIFAKFINEGKATIRFKDPEQDLCLCKADPLQLKNFLTLLRKASLGQNIDKINLSTLAPASNKGIDKPKTKLSVTSRKDYPLTKSFPSQLEHLHISQCRMKKIDSRIFQLKRLQHLDLRENVVEELPLTFSQLVNLRELILNSNRIQKLPSSLFLLPNWKQMLSLLDLSNNNITLLPVQLCELDNLVTLRVDHNKLETFPPTVGRLKKLKYLSASHNRIEVLPYSFMQLQLEHLDLFDNLFIDVTKSDLEEKEWQAPSLVECCARMIRKNRLPYSEDDLHAHLCRYLDSARVCWCGGFCFEGCVRALTSLSLQTFSPTVSAVDLQGRMTVPVLLFLCSPQCQRKYKRNPHAYWR
ncbi:leucine-rich repeat protein 1-like isoform X2 [Ostrea edulis]|nr:leucine-rich repeat protein 1-like isoform X2 [Ostrea edulis]XP_048736881.1 leucine-rich repeat protein 1-like isoform X2 [Ostrea edulis]XP_056020558.1 leucine-rich repeat protein 1-like isoform X2 [Ostrea edulis]